MACILWLMIWTIYPDKVERYSGRIFESVVCPPGGTRIELARYMSHGEILRGVATWMSG